MVGNLRLTDCGYKVVKQILEMIGNNHIVLPTEISLKQLEELSRCRVQSIGMAFDHSIKPALSKNGIEARKCGKPVVIQLKEKSNEEA